jgi:hypothetical protein
MVLVKKEMAANERIHVHVANEVHFWQYVITHRRN